MADGDTMSETPSQATRDRRQQYALRYNGLKNERSGWIDHWREIAENTRPRSFRYLTTDRATAGVKRNGKLVNGRPRWALRTLAAGMMAGITSPSRPWFRFTTGDNSLQDSQAVKEYLAQLEEEVREALHKSNIYNGLHKVYEDLGGIGTSALYIEADEEDVMRAYVFPVGQYCLASSPREAVDTIFREFEMTIGQLVKRFGKKNCSLNVQRMYANKQVDEWIKVLHVIEPNDTYTEKLIGPKGKKFASVWLELDADSSTGFLRESGYDAFPCMTPRWETTGEDIYGSSPGMDALGDCKALQLMERRKAQAIDKVVTPPMVGPGSMATKRLSLLSGDTTFADQTQGNQFRPAYEINVQAVGIIGQEIRENEARIDKAFYADLWLMLSQTEGQMTAREVVERREEKLLQLGPVMERLQDELLDPLIERVFAILLEAGRLPPPPEELAGRDLKIEYISIMAQAQKLLGTTGIERLSTFVGNLSTVLPAALDKINEDNLVDAYSGMLGTPPNAIRTAEEVAAIRAARAKQQQQAQQMAQAQAMAGTAKDLAAADLEGENGLSTMLRGLGAQ